MAIASIVQPLLQVALFQGLTNAQVNEIARRAERIVFKPGDTIAMLDAPAEGAILIVSGEARRVAGPGVASAESLPPGTLIGEMGMLVETSSSATVVAATPVRALRFSREEMLEQMAADPALAEHFISRITARLHDVASEMRAIDEGFDHLQAESGRSVPAARGSVRPDEQARLH